MGRLGRWLPLLLVPTALLPDLAAALPLRTYFFRDFTVTFLPLRLFAAREMREGRIRPRGTPWSSRAPSSCRRCTPRTSCTRCGRAPSSSRGC